MIDLHAVGQALALLFGSWGPWLVVVPGLVLGLIAGTLPGLGSSMVMILVLPFTLYMDFVSALVLLTSIYTGNGFGCAIPAILVNVPGSSGSVSTTFDGYPMAMKGQHNEALGLGLAASCVAEAMGYVLLIVLVVPIARFVLKLGPPDMLLVAMWGLTLIASLRGDSMVRGLIAGLLGLLLGTIGFSERGDVRGTLGIDYLLEGIPPIPALVGLFCAGEMFRLTQSDFLVKDASLRALSLRRIMNGFWMTFKYKAILVRGSVIGIIIGAVPGVGNAVSNLLAYNEARRTSKDNENFGKGDPRGVIAAESANSSSEAGSMATLLALGLPGSASGAVVLSVFALHNITGGPRFINDHLDIVYAVIFANLLQTVVLIPIGIGFIYLCGLIVRMPVKVLVPIVLAVAAFGCYSITGNVMGPATFLAFAGLGWFLDRFDYPVTATVVGLLLAPLTEGSLLRTYQLSVGNVFGYFSGRPITLILLALFVVTLFWRPAMSLLRGGRTSLPA